MVMPADFIISILSSAPPFPPEIIAPACPILLPGGAVRPAINAWVVKTGILELAAVDGLLGPYLPVSVVGTLVLLGLMVSLLPLKHLKFALQTVRVLSNDTELPITQVDVVVSYACCVDQLELVALARRLVIHRYACFASAGD